MTSVARRERREPDDSGEYSDTSQDIEHNNSGNDGGQNGSDYDCHRSDSEGSDSDPEKQETEKRVDDDEDRSNPQYIPKRGTFYEHDDRTAASAEEQNNTSTEPDAEKKEGSETSTERRRPPRKSDTLNKWSHDKYNENEQMPKSRDELVAIYGYDIRNEDAPPHARRNRRYGRGPNKYTRTWEDEEAYKRQVAQAPHKKPPSPADFPELNAANKPGRKPRPRPRSKSQPASNDSSESGSQLRRNASTKTPNPKQKPTKPAPNAAKLAPTSKQDNHRDPRDKIQIPLENLTITTTVNNNQGQPQRTVNAAWAQQLPVPTEQHKKKPLVTQSPQQNNTAKQPPLQQQKPPTQQQTQQPQQQQQATTGEPRGSKRYSSLRQRPLAETYSPQQPPQQTQQPPPQQPPTQPPPQQQPQQQQQAQPQQQHRYHGEFVGQGQPPQHQGSPGPQMHPQQIMHPVHRNAVAQQPHGPSPPHQTLQQPQHAQQQVRLGILEQQQIVQHPHHTIHNMPQPHAMGQLPPAPLQPAQGYAPPAMMPAQYMQQGGSGGVFGAAPIYQPPAAYPHQLYQHHNFVPQGTQAGGVTYYTCTEQEQPPRQPRRPTAAIPIVRPAHPERPANSSEKDNIDRIVDNMFLRKPWPAQGDAPKDKDSKNPQEPQSKETSQPNSLTSSSISTDSKPERTEKSEKTENENPDTAEA